MVIATEEVGELIWLSVGRCPPAEGAEAGGGDHWFVTGSGGKQGRVIVGRRTDRGEISHPEDGVVHGQS